MNTVDLSPLAKLKQTGPLFSSNHSTTLLAEKGVFPGGIMANYSQDYLVEYLLHYCRLCNKTCKQGTASILEALLEIQPENGEIYFYLGRQYEMAGELEAALDCFERAGSLRPDKPRYTLAAVSVACMLNKRSKALEMVINVISAYPDLAEAYLERGLIYVTDENWGRAQRDFEKCVNFDPNNHVYLTWLSTACRHQGLFKMAHRMAQKALRIDPNYEPAHEELRQIPFFQQFVDFFRTPEDE